MLQCVVRGLACSPQITRKPLFEVTLTTLETFLASCCSLFTVFNSGNAFNNNNNNNPICKAPECQKTSVALADRNSRAN